MQLHAKSIRASVTAHNAVHQALCPPAVARSRTHRLPPVQASAAVIEAPVQQQTAYDALHHLSLVSEQLEQEQLPCQQLHGNFFDEFQLGETLGQASQRKWFNHALFATYVCCTPARQAHELVPQQCTSCRVPTSCNCCFCS
jgi:hypothetical protein